MITFQVSGDVRPGRGTAWRVVVTATGMFVALLILPFALQEPLRSLVIAAFAPVCHQLPERTLHIDGVPMAVCSRCLGMYAGMFAGTISFAWARRWDVTLGRWAGILLLVALGVPGVDWLGGVLELWGSSHGTRIVTGATFGVIAGYFLARGAAGLSRSRRSTDELHGSES